MYKHIEKDEKKLTDEEHKTLIDCDKLFDFVGNLAKEKGVEVE